MSHAFSKIIFAHDIEIYQENNDHTFLLSMVSNTNDFGGKSLSFSPLACYSGRQVAFEAHDITSIYDSFSLRLDKIVLRFSLLIGRACF